MRDNTHAPTHTHVHAHAHRIFLCQRDERTRGPVSSLARTLVTSRKYVSHVTLLCNFNNHILRSSRIRWRMTRIHLVALHFGVPRYVTGYCRGKSSRVIGSDRTKGTKAVTQKIVAACPRGYTDSSIMNSSTLHLHSVRAENCLRAICALVTTTFDFSTISRIRYRRIPDNALDYPMHKLKLLLKTLLNNCRGGRGEVGGK